MKYLRLITRTVLIILVPVIAFSAPLFDNLIKYPVGPGPLDICAADFNGDGYADLALANYTYSDAHDLSILINNGDGTFADYVYYSTGLNYMCTMTAADLDNDGDIDLALARSANTNTIVTMLNDGDGTFQLSQTYDAGDYALSICAYDLDNDNWNDLAVAYETSNELSIMFNNGDNTFADGGHYDSGTWATSVAGGDFNKDGAVDLVVTNAITGLTSGRLSVYLNNGDGTFADSVNYPSGWQPYSVVTGDFNGDSNLDLAVADGDYAGHALILMGNGSGEFQDPVYYNTGHSAHDICTADLDDNGSLDLVIGHTTDSTVVVLLNNGDGTFAVEGSYMINNYIYSVCCADFDHDGDIDIAAGGHTHGQAVILFNQIKQPTAVIENSDENMLSTSFVLYQNYPNPFNPVTTIEFSLLRRSFVRIDVFNLIGQKVRTLVDREESAGSYSITWDGTDVSGEVVSTGIYFYRFQAGDYVETKKMSLLK